jgi:7,8-dihydropterin-6-yl-methyl-4-(beta-D-ribofuranosyl)aminobenzene 5'-phosphate synthase
MAGKVKVTTLVENTAGTEGTRAEHGLAFWIEWDGQHVLFDTGQSDLLAHNARQLGVDLSQADAIILSHGHYDHTGGLATAIGAAPKAIIYAHTDVAQARYARNRDGTSRSIGMTADAQTSMERAARIARTDGPTEVLDGLWVTGSIPRQSDYEDTGGPFFVDESCTVPDLLPDDQAAFFDTTDGTAVLLGCAHSGVVNTLEHIRTLAPGRKIHTVMGGMHLVAASDERMDRTVERLARLDVLRLGPAHCTGKAAVARLAYALPGRCFPVVIGTAVEFERP